MIVGARFAAIVSNLIDRHDAAGWFSHCGYQVG
jgi:hypothetical protein